MVYDTIIIIESMFVNIDKGELCSDRDVIQSNSGIGGEMFIQVKLSKYIYMAPCLTESCSGATHTINIMT